MKPRTGRKKELVKRGWVLVFGSNPFAPRGTKGRVRFKAYMKKSVALSKAVENNCKVWPCRITVFVPTKPKKGNK